MKNILILSIILLTSCGGVNTKKSSSTKEVNNTEQQQKEIHNSQNSLDYGGTYEGIIPCADCPGIEISITLDYKNKYTKKMTYQNREPNNVFTSKGRYEWNEIGNKITLLNETVPEIYQVGENKLTMLDLSGNKIAGENADKYVLRQVNKL
ncbi:copper resistance protein NlpE [Bacteroidales bacterium OttesenSCG-928-I21]|nr:copper resistance protein NlpE [Bacteroidales bacterium OttesenSCG-928-I21]